MVKFLSLCLFILTCVAVFFKFQSDSRQKRLTDAENRIIALETAINEQKHMIEVYAQADKEAKEFEKELNNDETDNLDVVPADYILEQLHAD